MAAGFDEMEWMKEGVWLKEEETMDMVQSLMQTEAYLKDDDIVVEDKDTTLPTELDTEDINAVLEHLDNEDAVKSVQVLEEIEVAAQAPEDNKKGTTAAEDFQSLPSIDDDWWKENPVAASGGDDIENWGCDWSFEDDLKMWEWVWYPYTTAEFPWDIELWDMVDDKLIE